MKSESTTNLHKQFNKITTMRLKQLPHKRHKLSVHSLLHFLKINRF